MLRGTVFGNQEVYSFRHRRFFSVVDVHFRHGRGDGGEDVLFRSTASPCFPFTIIAALGHLAVAATVCTMARTDGKSLGSLVRLIYLLSLAVFCSSSAHPAYEDDTPSFAVYEGELSPQRTEEHDGGRIIDISHYYRDDMPAWESAEGVGQFLWLRRSMKDGDVAYFSELKLPVHSGTHVDSPAHVFQHYYDVGFDVDTLDLQVLNGPALMVDVPRDKNITADVMESLNIPKGVRRVLFRTINTDRKLMWKKEFDTSYVGFMKDGAQWLVDNTDIKLVGIDYLSIAAFDDLIPSHLVLLQKREIIIVEGLNLDNVKPGIYNLHCLSPRLRGAEGSPIRCILIK